NYRIVLEKSVQLAETIDDDGDPCENLESLEHFVLDSLAEILSDTRYSIKAVNFSAYGASFVHIDDQGRPAAPLYNYLKDYPPRLLDQFYDQYGDRTKIARETSSPVLGNLNSGMQLYQIKYQKPALFNRIKYSLHLPQYLSYLI